ncbi:MAG: hypothetical protein KKB30_11005 [Proteobacteria bacterium]|nr:hypothetical protein [Pseudomonadota bacterium]MBU1714558.1 hypothetical protein [Pseudomonadota bacterium]
MRKIILVVVLISAFGLSARQMVMAQPGVPCGPMAGASALPCPNSNYGGQGVSDLSEEEIKARDEFLAQTVEIRKELAVKQAEMAAIMKQEKPDEKKVGKLAGEIFDLRDKFRKIAEETGVKSGCGPGACGCGLGNGPGGMGMMGGRRHQGGCYKHMMKGD